MSKSLKILAVSLIVVMFIGTTGFYSTSLAKEKIKIGFIGPLTGGNASMGLGGRNSFQLAVLQYNRGEFGPKKYEYEAVIEDDTCVPATGVRVATKMASNPSIIAGASHYCSMVGIATKPVFTQYKYPSMIWGAVLPAITIPSSKFISRVNGTQREQNAFHAAWHNQSKFGISLIQFDKVLELVEEFNIKINGIHLHSSHVILNKEVFAKGVKTVFDIAKQFEHLEYVDFGGGIMVKHQPNDTVVEPNQIGKILKKELK